MNIKKLSIVSEEHIRNKIYVISFICSLLVMWIHTFNLEVYGIGNGSVGLANVIYCIETYWANITSIAVPFFFVLSGFLFFRTFSRNVIWNKYKTRFRTVVIPYLCWCTIYYIYYVALSNIPFIRAMLAEEDIVELSLQNWLRSLWYDSYYTLWFLKNLILFIAISPLLYVVLKNWKKQVPTGIVLVIFLFLNNQYGWINIINGLEWYALGSWIGINYKEYVLYKNKVISLAGLGYIVCILVTGFQLWNIWLQIIFYVALWVALDLFIELKKVPDWMKLSFFTYVAHDIFLEAFEKLFFVVLGSNPIWALIDYVFMPGFVLMVLISISVVLKKYLPWLWQILVGWR